MKKRQLSFLKIVVAVVVFSSIFGLIAFYFGNNFSFLENRQEDTAQSAPVGEYEEGAQSDANENRETPVATGKPIVTIPPSTSKPTSSPPALTANSTIMTYEGISYRLPDGWVATEDSWGLMISPKTGGGYLKLEIYSYPKNIGRREYYCQTSGVCIEGTTYFTEIAIGNIGGYMANAIDNSGGGVDYFGAKGDKFYRIVSYKPPSPNEFESKYRQVLSSFEF